METEMESKFAKLKLDVVEPASTAEFNDSEDEVEESEREITIELKEGLDLRDLLDLKPVTLELAQPFDQHAREENYFESSEVLKYLNPQCSGVSEMCSDEDEDNSDLSPFEKMALGMEKIIDDGGVLKKITKPGQGCKIPDGAMVRIHYNAYLEYGDEPFDSTKLRGNPMRARLGCGGLLIGLEIGVASMTKSEEASFLLQSGYAYGGMGCPPRIPGGATVLFEVELLDFIDYAAVLEVEHLTEEERKEGHFAKIYAACKAEHFTGNDYFKQKNYGKAIIKFSRAVVLLEKCNLKDAEEETKQQNLLLKLYLNLALCRLRTNKPVQAIVQCNKAMEIEACNVKALYLKGKAKGMLSEYRQAREFLKRALNQKPGNSDIIKELIDLDRKEEVYITKEKLFYSRMFMTSGRQDASSKTTSESDVPKEFQALVEERLKEFCRDSTVVEIPFPYELSDPEFKCLSNLVTRYGLEIKEIMGRNKKEIKIVKVSDENLC